MKEICRFHVRTGEPSNCLTFLDFTVAKCPLAETLSRMETKEKILRLLERAW